MRVLAYDDFTIKIEPSEDDSKYVAHVLQSPYGGTSSAIEFPPEIGHLRAQVRGLETIDPSRDLRQLAADGGDGVTPRQWGRILYEALFRDSIKEKFLLSLGRVQGRAGTGLRIRLVMDPTQRKMAPLCALPWELLYRPETHDFLSRSPYTSVVRYLEANQQISLSPPKDVLRILVVSSMPLDLTPLPGLDDELARIVAAWGRGATVEITTLEGATLADVRRALCNAPYHVVHFMGHGVFDESTGEGVLLFEASGRRPRPITGEVFAEILRGHRTLRLVFLNACDTGQFPRRHGQDPYAGVAAAMVRGGVAAVLAMQHPIADRLAVAFSGALYAAAATGDPVEEAVREGRLAIYESAPQGSEWATPVLFTGVPELRIVAPFDPVDLSQGDSLGRQRTARRLGHLGNPQAIRPIEERWDDEPDPTVRYWLAHALGKIGGPRATKALHGLKRKERDRFALRGIEDALNDR